LQDGTVYRTEDDWSVGGCAPTFIVLVMEISVDPVEETGLPPQ